METLSICIISKNEEDNIEKCINSIKGVADEIIVVDTGSSDNTVNNAKRLGARVIEIKWINDFSYARNISIENATKQWILILDCDEEIKECEGYKLKKLIENDTFNNDEKKGYYLKLKNIVNNNITGETTVFRLFKNDKNYRFKGKLHEQIIDSITNINGLDCIGLSDVEILHYGYDKSIKNIDDKSKRNFEILLSYNEDEKNDYYYYALGNEYGRINKNNEAIKNYEKSISLINFKNEKNFYPYLIVNFIKTLYKNKNYNGCLDEINKYIKIFDDLKDLYFIKFLCNTEIMDMKEARKSLEMYLNIKKQKNNYPTTYYADNDVLKGILDTLKSY